MSSPPARILFFTFVFAFTSCSRPQRQFQPSPDPHSLDDATFLHYLQTLPVVTVDEGMRAVLLLQGTTGQWPTYEARAGELLHRKAVRPEWKLQADELIDKGTLAHMVLALTNLPRSANNRLASWTRLGDRRYALKTCVHEGLMPYAVDHERVTGGELLALLAAAERNVFAGEIAPSSGPGPSGSSP